VWTGSLAFGLVSIPVKLYNATSPKDVRFHQFQAGTARRIRHRRVVEPEPVGLEPDQDRGHTRRDDGPPRTPVRETVETEVPLEEEMEVPLEEEMEVPLEDVVKGYEVEPDRYVMIEPRELEALAPERTRTIEIAEFVDLADVDPIYFEKSYHVAPGPGGERPYWLLHRAMREAGRVAVATFVMRTREYLAAVRPADGVIVLETLFYQDEVRDPRELGIAEPSESAPRELDIAQRLIDSLATTWDPSCHRDTYRERVLELIESRAQGAVTAAPAAREPEGPQVPDFMAALQASLEAIKQPATGGRGKPRKRRTG
jgi:DNA end-binding protein Ku